MQFQPLLADLFGLFASFWLLAILIGIAATVFWVWMLVDCATNTALQGTDKIVWVLVILFLHGLGALIYYFAGRGKAV